MIIQYVSVLSFISLTKTMKLLFVPLLFITITLVSKFILSDVICNENDIISLLMFKKDLIDRSNRLSSWTGLNCCEWAGVVCNNSTGRVHEIRLRNPHDSPCSRSKYTTAEFEAYSRQKIGGNLNPSLLDMKKHLTHLDLSCNDFEGAHIPDFIGFLENLQYLDLSSVGFQGEVPYQLGNLSGLKYLNLGDFFYSRNFVSKNKLSIGNMQWLSRLSSLEHLDLTGANLSEASNWLRVFNNLPSLVDLHLSRCGLRLFDSTGIVNFTSLRVLDLSGNNFDSLVPHWIGSLENLVHLDLSECGLYNHLSIDLRNMTRLRYLNLSSNNFNFTFPKWFSKFVHLEVLDFSDNLIHGEALTTIGNLTSLVFLDLSRNKLEGTITKSLCNLHRLGGLYLSGNMFSGDIQNFLQCISKKLIFLYLGSNNMSGRLPTNLGQLERIRAIDLVNNKLTGPLPISLGELHELEYFAVSLNSLEGVVSEAHFRNMSSLKIFRANGNKLTFRPSENWIPPFQVIGLSLRAWQLGPKFPRWIEHMTSLSYLTLVRTGIADSIPDWFWDKTISRMGHLNLSGNLIHGQIPSLLNFRSDMNVAVDMKCNLIDGPLPPISSSISILDLSHNRFSGPMHRFLCNDVVGKNRLEILNLGDNFLSGQIPDCWINWPLLRVLRLEDNNLTGEIPSSVGFLTKLQSLHLRRNNLSGEIPPSLQKCNELMVLDLGRNYLTGRLPVWIYRLSKMVVLNLRLNEFWGEISFQLCRLNSLQTLDLAGNNFSGNIPTCFGNFSVMVGKQPLTDHIYYSAFDTFGGVPDSQFLVLKGRFREYINNLQFVMVLDLSNNGFSGSIPVEITKLVRVQSLNLSQNSLSGTIPKSIADMEFLESLDISRNKLSGEIPTSISGLTFLSHLNLSYNNLTGRIPTGTQIQGFDRSGFIGNQLCGPPLSGKCDEDNETSWIVEDEDESDGSLLEGERFEFFLSALLGFIFGFWLVIGPLFISISWRVTYFRCLTRIWNYVYYVCIKIFVRGW